MWRGAVGSRSVGALAARSITTETFKRLVGMIGATTDHHERHGWKGRRDVHTAGGRVMDVVM